MALHSGHYVYMIVEREYLSVVPEVIKVGFSTNFTARARAYPKSSLVLATFRVSSGRDAERAIITAMRARYVRRKDIGAEYFQVDDLCAAMNLFAVTATRFACSSPSSSEVIEDRMIIDG